MKLRHKLALALIVSFPFSISGWGYDQSNNILALENQVWTSFVGPHPDIVAFEKMVTPDYLCIEANGVLLTKQANIAQLNSLTFSSFHIQDPSVRMLSADSALIVARVHFEGTLNGEKMSGETLTSTVWVRKHGKWLAQIHTETNAK